MATTVGIVGAGLMGNGIAQVAAAAGFKVILMDVSRERVEAGQKAIETSLARLVTKNSLDPADRDATLGRLSLSTSTDDFAGVDLAIEAATENEGIKRDIFAKLARVLGANALLASNTSSIPITRLGAATDRPDRFLGLHFFNPVPVMRLLEVIRGLATSDETVARAHSFAQALGKTVVESRDSPSFIVNRVLCPMLNEAIFALGEGLGGVEDIDNGMRLGANHPMGPLQLADFVGLDTLLAVMRVMHDSFGDSKYRPAPLLVQYVDAGWLGRKNGRGFYDYSDGKMVPTR